MVLIGIDSKFQYKITSLDRKVFSINTIIGPRIVPLCMVLTVKTHMLIYNNTLHYLKIIEIEDFAMLFYFSY